MREAATARGISRNAAGITLCSSVGAWIGAGRATGVDQQLRAIPGAERRKRFLARLDDPDKNWKFSVKDARERKLWEEYQAAYEDMIQHTATEHAPWFVVPADHKWFTRAVVAAAVATALEDFDLKFPSVGPAKRKELKTARRALSA